MSDTLSFVSIYFILIPAAASLPTLRHYRLSAIMFVLFILSVITEQIMLHNRPLGEWIVFDLYCLAECTLFLWIVRTLDDRPTIHRFRTALLIALPAWIFFLFIIPGPLEVYGQELTGCELFNSLYQVCIAFLAARKILRIIETTPGPYETPIFWIVLGIFVYCFGTFFEMIYLRQKLVSREIWHIHNIINILTYILYSIGLVKAYAQKHPTEKPSP